MTRTRAAAVLREYGAPLRLETVTVPELRDDEVLVQIHGVGICHTDLTAAAGGVPVPRPVVPGHEGAGVVTEQGSTIVVFDLGAVGTAAVMTERISLCENIIVVAPDPRRHGLRDRSGPPRSSPPTITTTSDAICVASPAVVPAMRWSPWAPNP
ncbi:alcohol dehydrogenase catalytic domain-containing protein [Rhodococcus pyridinivorans]|uniref:alcohol dehydrogenase catalytic domain-containing protein n=1 Tax=Rhodococcus TaxID=1827 RepID=UPI0002F01824|nr:MULTISPECIES: alcohol dehydrogenase catalytic domain-containing protein [Rhodococcus]MCW3472242.1 alcohol dehydrogenase catalytic domain-containing protein [Rhodococcus pyridinivorans]UVT23092.1 alcohol dehydrogenase catalytic domain-containing protein [Rhodococcus pyridinivorans]